MHTIHLTPPQISEFHIQEKIICIRAHRERIFRVEPELIKNKLIMHNYGQGGAGWTFLFGCVHESLCQFEQQLTIHPSFKNKSITVIGAGCYGLLTAILLGRKGFDVRIVAKEMHDIPSYKAAGFFFPRTRKCSTVQECAVFHALGMESYRTYMTIIEGQHPFINHGPRRVPAYYGVDIDPGFSPYIERGLLRAPRKVVVDFGTGKAREMMEYQTLFIDSVRMMAELHRVRQEMGIKIVRDDIADFQDVADQVIFNSAGYGAKKLTHDPRIVPVQGHLITLKNQQDMTKLNYMINVKVTMKNAAGMPRDELLYYAPKESGILGITFIRGQESVTANFHEFERLIERAQDFFY